jgi:hypothetical protein
MSLWGGKMIVYTEVTYFINALLLFLSFEILAFLCNIRMTKKEILKYILTFNISVILTYIDLFDGFLILYYLILCLFYFKKQAYIFYPIFIFIYISMLSFFDLCVDGMIVFQEVLIVEGFNISSLFTIVIIALIAFYFYIYYCSLLLESKNDYVDIFIGNKQYRGFIDNGNKVYYKGYPLIFFNKNVLDKYKIIDRIQIHTALKEDTIEIIEIEEMIVNHQTIHHLYVGLIEELEYDCILSPKLMGGIL